MVGLDQKPWSETQAYIVHYVNKHREREKELKDKKEELGGTLLKKQLAALAMEEKRGKDGALIFTQAAVITPRQPAQLRHSNNPINHRPCHLLNSWRHQSRYSCHIIYSNLQQHLQSNNREEPLNSGMVAINAQTFRHFFPFRSSRCRLGMQERGPHKNILPQ